MPTYEYECQSCHQRVEAVQRFTDPDLTTCAVCGGSLRKVYSAVGIVFKGSGFYKNDSRSTSGTGGVAATTKATGESAKETPKESAKETASATTPAATTATTASTASSSSSD